MEEEEEDQNREREQEVEDQKREEEQEEEEEEGWMYSYYRRGRLQSLSFYPPRTGPDGRERSTQYNSVKQSFASKHLQAKVTYQ